MLQRAGAAAALALTLALAMARVAAAAEGPAPNATAKAPAPAARWRAPAAAERRGWVPLNMPCPTCRRTAPDSSPQGAAVVGRAVPPPPQFQQQQQLQQPFLQPFQQPFQQQLLLGQHSVFGPAPPPPPPSPDDQLYQLLRPQQTHGSLSDLATAAALPPLPQLPPLSSLSSLSSLPPLPQGPPQAPQPQQLKQSPSQDAAPAPPREEVQLLYVPVEALRPRGRVQQPLLQSQLQSPQPGRLLLPSQSPAPPAPPSPPASPLPLPSSTAATAAPSPSAAPTTALPTVTTSLSPASITPALLSGRHRFRTVGPPPERSRYLEQPLPRPLASSSPAPSPTTSTTPAPHQPPLSIFVGRRTPGGGPRVGDVISALRGSHSIAVMDEPGPSVPDVFVGPANLPSPPGFSKFDLPYLSTIMAASRGEKRVDRLPFFVAPLSFRPPPGYSKIPFPAPHVGSVVVANATAPNPLPVTTTTTTQAAPTVSLPADLPPISAELPSLVNSLQDHRSTGNVVLLPNQGTRQQQVLQQNGFQQKPFIQQKKQHLSQVYQPQQQLLQQPIRQQQQTIDYRQTTKTQGLLQNNYNQQQQGKTISYQTQLPDLYDQNTELPVEEPATTLPPLLFSTQQQREIEQFQQEYLHSLQQKPFHQKPVLRQQQQFVQQQQQFVQQQQQQPLHSVHQQPALRQQEPLLREPEQQQPKSGGRPRVEATLPPPSRYAVPVHEENFPVTDASLDAPGAEHEEALTAGLHTLQAGLALQRETDTTTTTTTTTTPSSPTSRRPHFRGRQRASTSLPAGVGHDGSLLASPDPTRRPGASRSRRPLHPSRVRTPDDETPAPAPAYTPQRNHRFRGRTTTTTSTTTTTTTADPTTLPFQYESYGDTTPAYQQLNYDPESAFHSDKTYQQEYRVETTPDYEQRAAFGAEGKRGSSYANAERPTEAPPSYQAPLHSQQRHHPALPADSHDIAHQNQYFDDATYRHVTSDRPAEEQSALQVSPTAPAPPPPPSAPVEDSSTPSSEGTTSMEPPAAPDTFTRTRGRKTHRGHAHGHAQDAAGGDSPAAHEPTPPPVVTYRPSQVRSRGRVRAQARPRAPPEPENYPPNFHDAAVFDATRRPAADYSYEPQSPPASSTEANTRGSRQRGHAARGPPRRTPAPADHAPTDNPTAADSVYTVRPARRPQAAPARVTSVRGRIRRPTTTTPKATTEASTTTAAADTDALPSAHAGGFQANEVLQQPSAAVPDYYDYLASDAVHESSGVLTDFRRPVTYEDDDPEAGGAESQWTSKWQSHDHPNALPTEPLPAPATDAPTTAAPASPATPAPFDDATAPGADFLAPEPSATDAAPASPSATAFASATSPAVPDVTASATGASASTTGASASADAATTEAERKQRRVRVRVRTRVNLRDMLEPAESQHVATLANAIPASPAKTTAGEWSGAPHEPLPPATEPLGAAPDATTTPAPAPTDAPAFTDVPATNAPATYAPATDAPATEISATDAPPKTLDNDASPDPATTLAPELQTTTTTPTATPTAAATTTVAPTATIKAENSSRTGLPSRQALPRPEEDAEEPLTSTITEPPAPTTTLAPPAMPDDITTTPSAKQYSDIQRVRGAEDATARLLGTSTTTEVSHETEICYRGRCVKTKTQPDAPVAPAAP